MSDKKYKSATTKFYEDLDDEVVEEKNLDMAKTVVASGVPKKELIYEEYEDEEYEDEEYEDEEYEDEEYEDEEYEDEEYEEKKKNFFKSKKTKYAIIGSATGILLIALLVIAFTIGKVEYIENVEIYVDNTIVHTFDKVEKGAIDEKIIELGYNEEEYKKDKIKKSTENKIYLVQKKEITVSFFEKKWENETKDVFNYKLGDVLVELKIELSEDSVVYVNNTKIDNTKYSETPIRDSMHIKIVNNSNETIEEEIVIPFTTYEKLDDTLAKGERKVRVEGVNGIKKITYKVYYSNGQEVDREKISEEIIKEPVNEVISIGNKKEEPKGSEVSEQ
ncbi:MAG: G5 domain-containing protein [Bacilli bacterium]